MSSGKSKHFAAPYKTTALVLAGMLVMGSGLTAMAQSENAGSVRASKGHGARRSRSATENERGLSDFPSQIFVCQRGHAHRHDRRPTPLPKHAPVRFLEPHERPHLQRGDRGLLF